MKRGANIEAEFADLFDGLPSGGRRDLLKAMTASLALGLGACSNQPDEQALPYVNTPEFMVPGKPRHYATAVTFCGYAQPVLGTTVDGRPTKLEGLPNHPSARGAADAFTQASILELYDPERSRGPQHAGQPAAWSDVAAAMGVNASRLDARQGEGFRLLSGRQTSPTFARQMEALMRRWPRARWHVHEPVGAPLVLPALEAAPVVVCLDADPLGPGPAQTHNARLWSARRRAFQAGQANDAMFVAEPTPSLTGSVATARLASAHHRIGLVLQALDAVTGQGGPPPLNPAEQAFVDRVVAAIAACGKALVLTGPGQPAAVRAMAAALTARLGGPALPADPALPPPDGAASLQRLADDCRAGRVDTLVILDSNPAYTAPDVWTALTKARLKVHAGLHRDETAMACDWHAPLEHDLESWSDARAVDGTVSLIQPLVRPFYDVRSRHAVLELVQGHAAPDARALVAQTWQAAWGGDFDARWREGLTRGFIDAPPPATSVGSSRSPGSQAAASAPAGLELVFRPDPCVWDGRLATNPFLQELPKPLNKVTWGNVLAISPALARRLNLANGDVARVQAAGQAFEGPVWVTRGQANDSITAFLGGGRRLPGMVGDGRGYHAYPLASGAGAAVGGVTLVKTDRRERLAVTQPTQDQQGGDIVRAMSREQAKAPRRPRRTASLYPEDAPTKPAWAMSIDTDVCIGCNACVTACDAENNIAMVGPDQVEKGRAMHWLRVDHYAEGEDEAARDLFQPAPCMHCEQAPCEIGCPVNATVHSPDGLNVQVYNRCIGTRTCSSYCPYKVRRFNWFDYTAQDSPERQAQRNPNVTVRSRGVMEKCTYCIQRIRGAQIDAEVSGKPLADGDVRTACQQTCPTDAIVFGDITDPDSAISRAKAQGRSYVLLEELNTRPRTSYLARLEPDPAEEG